MDLDRIAGQININGGNHYGTYWKHMTDVLWPVLNKAGVLVCLSAQPPQDDDVRDWIERVGKTIAQANQSLIWGGTEQGLMGILANSYLEERARLHQTTQSEGLLIGVALDFPGEEAYEAADLYLKASDFNDRLKMMFFLSHTHVALWGGFGTFLEIWPWAQHATLNPKIRANPGETLPLRGLNPAYYLPEEPYDSKFCIMGLGTSDLYLNLFGTFTEIGTFSDDPGKYFRKAKTAELGEEIVANAVRYQEALSRLPKTGLEYLQLLSELKSK